MLNIVKQIGPKLCTLGTQNCKFVGQIRHRGRPLRRRALAALTPGEADVLHGKRNPQEDPAPYEGPDAVWKRSLAKENKSNQNENVRPHHQQDFTGFRLPEGVHYEKIQEGDKRMGPVMMAARNRKTREKTGLILLEGKRLIADAINAGAKLQSIFFSKVEHLEGLYVEETDAKLYKANYNHLKIWSDLSTTPGVMAVCHMPGPGTILTAPRQLPLTLICDNIRDPGNMGTLLRSAAAVGCQNVLLTKGCVDIWDPKVLRAGAGSHFRCHMIKNLGWEMIGNYLSNDCAVFLADSTISQYEPTTAAKQSTMETLSEFDNDDYIEKDEDGKNVDSSFLEKAHVKLFENLPLHTTSLYDTDFIGNSSAIVVGGETQGLSAEAVKLAFHRNGSKVFIPMMPGVDSLNAAIAGTLVMFEIKRQIIQNSSKD